MKMINIDFLIESLGQTDVYMETIFLNGGCYDFHLFLKKLYPEAIPYITEDKAHVVTYYKGKFYDIRGEVDDEKYEKLEDISLVENWNFARHNLLKIKECPECEYPLTAKI